MVQYKKDLVRERITRAALEEMARFGYEKTTMAAIAHRADLATGNIYRYFKNKSDLFLAILPDRFLRSILSLLTKKVRALDGVDDVRTLPSGSPFHLLSDETLDFMIDHRLRLIILLAGTDGSPHEGFSERVVRHLQKLATEHFRSVDPGFTLSKLQKFNLGLAYRHFVGATSEILLQYERAQDMRQALIAYMQYHQGGLHAMLARPFPS